MDCGHCGNSRDMVRISEGEVDKSVQYHPEARTVIEEGTTAVLLRCPRCSNLTLYTCDYASYLDDRQPAPVLIYPRPRDLSPVPAEIRREYQKAQQVKAIDAGYYALGLRRTLETVCAVRGIQGPDLYRKLKKLVEETDLPRVFEEMAHYLRRIGNLGAHVGDINVLKSDVEAATDFIEAILEYLYIAPAKLKRVADELNARKRARSAGSSEDTQEGESDES